MCSPMAMIDFLPAFYLLNAIGYGSKARAIDALAKPLAKPSPQIANPLIRLAFMMLDRLMYLGNKTGLAG